MIKESLFLTLFVIGIQVIGISQEDTTYQEIEEVLVSSEREKEIVFEDSKYYIVDFTLSETNTLLLIKNMGTYFLYQLDEDLEVTEKLRIEQNASSLFEDCFGNTHLLTKDSAYFILDDLFGISLIDVQSKDQFMDAMMKCVGSTSEKIIFEEFTKLYQFHEFYTVDMVDGARKTIYEINDTIRAKSLYDAGGELYSNIVTTGEKMRSEEMSAEVMHDGSGELEENRRYREMNARGDRIIFFEGHVAVSKYNPMFVVEDTLYFFNHSDGQIDQLDDTGKKLRSIPISYHLNSGWANQIYLDVTNKRFYGLNTEDGVYKLTGIPLNNESQVFTSEITKHAHPKKVLIRDGYAYYTYKPNVDSNLNKLYRQRL